MKKIFLSIATIVLLSSCATQTFKVNPNAIGDNPTSAPSSSTTSDFVFSGVGQSNSKSLAGVCPNDKVDFVSTKSTGVNVLLSLLTVGIYTPQTMNVWCSASK